MIPDRLVIINDDGSTMDIQRIELGHGQGQILEMKVN